MTQNIWGGLHQTPDAEQRTGELKYAIEHYTLPALAELWSREAGVLVETVARTLASAILSGALPRTDSAEVVYVSKDSNGVVLSVYSKEKLQLLTIPGVQPTPFNGIDVAQIAGWMQDKLSRVAIDGDMADEMLRLITITRDDFKAWLQSIRMSLPAFWFPDSTSKKKKAGNGNQVRRQSPPAAEKTTATRAIHDFWYKRADELRKQNSARTLKDIAQEIAQDKTLNPRDANAETIRRIISARRG